MPAAVPWLAANGGSALMADVMIGIDPHKSSHTAVAIGLGEERLGELQVRACPSQAGQLLAWAQEWPERAWAVEGAAWLRWQRDWQLVGGGERVLDVRASVASRGRLPRRAASWPPSSWPACAAWTPSCARPARSWPPR